MNKFLRYTLLSVVSMMAGIGSAQTVFNLDNDYATIFPTITGTSSTTSTAGDFTAPTTSIAKDGITLTVSTSTASTANRIWSSSPRLRLYGGTLTIAAENATITAIELVNGKWNTGNTTDTGTLTGATGTATWAGSADNVVLTIAGNTQFKSITVTAVPKGGTFVAAPTITGDSPFLGTTTVTLSGAEGTSLFYTTDGSQPTNASTPYSAPFDLTASATVKAVAYDGTTASSVATKTFTAAYNATDINDFTTQGNGTVQNLTLENAKVVYANATNSNVYVKDATGALCFYNAGLNLKTGDVLNGSVAGKLDIFNNLPEFVNNSLTNTDRLTVTPGTPVGPNTLTISEVKSTKYISDLVQISGVKLDSVSKRLYASQGTDSIQIYDTFKVFADSPVITPSANNTVTGILIIYNTTYEILPISVEGVQTTAIEDLKASAGNTDAPTYNLAGQRVDASYKGVVIRNGRKFVRR